jgi:hypothetical protein
MFIVFGLLVVGVLLGMSRSETDELAVKKYRPMRDEFGRSQRNHHGELIVEVYKQE